MKSSISQEQLQPPPQPLLGQQARRHVFRYWTWEFFSLAVCLASLFAIVGILVRYDGKALPEWPHDLNINTIVALLSTILRACMVTVVAGIIGQAKWSWFSAQPRPMQHFQAFDEASRGVFGSFNLIGVFKFGFRGSFATLIAALVTISSLAIGPFTQQAIKTVSRLGDVPVNSSNALLPVAVSFPGVSPGGFHGRSGYQLAPLLQAAIISSITNSIGNNDALQIRCSTGDCEFPPEHGVLHSTLGVCSQCIDARAAVNFSSDSITMDGLTLMPPSNPVAKSWVASKGRSNLSFVDSLLTPEMRDASSQALANISVLSFSYASCKGDDSGCKSIPDGLYVDDSHHLSIVAVACTVYTCLKDFTATITDGQLHERVTSTTPAKYDGNWRSIFQDPRTLRMAVKSPCVVDGQRYETGNFSLVPKDSSKRDFITPKEGDDGLSVPSDCYYSIAGDDAQALGDFLSQQMNATCSRGREDYVDCLGQWWLSRFFKDQNSTTQTMEETFDSWATGLTNIVRTYGAGRYFNDRRNVSDGVIIGQARRNTAFIKVKWLWLLFPIALCLFTILALTSMLVSNSTDKRQLLWKSSTLPLLFAGIATQADHSAHDPTRTDSLREMTEASKRVRIKLQPDAAAGTSGFVQYTDKDSGHPDDEQAEVDSLYDAGEDASAQSYQLYAQSSGPAKFSPLDRNGMDYD